MALQTPRAWEAVLCEVVSSPGVTVVLGAPDVGKTSFCAILANAALEAGIAAAIVDSDMGQSEIGPPGTIGLGLVESPIQCPGDLSARALYFVGATSPVGHLLATATGAKLLTDRASASGRELVILDTTGLVRGPIARKLKTHKIELLRPRHLVAIQQANELEHIIRFFDSWRNCKVHRIPASPYARPRTPAVRAQRRAVRFREYFAGGRVHDFSLREIATAGTWLRAGCDVEPRHLRFASTALGTEAVHGEWVGRTMYLVTERDYDGRGVTQLQETFGTNSLVIVPASRYSNLLVGLLDDHLELLALGVVTGIDFMAQRILAYTPLRSVAPVRSIKFGTLKVRTDGIEIGRIRPGEV